jgi:predicted amidohydrolase
MATPDLNLTLVQTELFWHDPAANRLMLDNKLRALAGVTDLVVLPEMFTTGFTMEPERAAEVARGPSIDWMRDTARTLNAVVTGSISTHDGGRFYNRLTWMRPDGTSATYDKRHLFRMAEEHRHYTAGARRLVVELRGWRVCPMICYDLRFPVWSRNRGDYDVLIYVANWPSRGRHAWHTLLKARAVENLCYCVGVNRLGADGSGVEHTGDTMAFDFLGRPMFADSEKPFVQPVSLKRASLDDYRLRFPAHLDADQFDICIESKM